MRVFFSTYRTIVIIASYVNRRMQKSYKKVIHSFPMCVLLKLSWGKGKAERTVKPAAGREITRPQRQQQQHRRVWRRQL